MLFLLPTSFFIAIHCKIPQKCCQQIQAQVYVWVSTFPPLLSYEKTLFNLLLLPLCPNCTHQIYKGYCIHFAQSCGQFLELEILPLPTSFSIFDHSFFDQSNTFLFYQVALISSYFMRTSLFSETVGVSATTFFQICLVLFAQCMNFLPDYNLLKDKIVSVYSTINLALNTLMAYSSFSINMLK